MKKWIIILISSLLVLSLSGCSKSNDNLLVEDGVLVEETLEVLNDVEGKKDIDSEKLDVDLTKLSSTMIYAEVYNIMSHPQDYLGKRIKIFGEYSTAESSSTNLTYHYIIIKDATECCQGGLEFISDSYPKEGSEAEITGIFSSYEELGETYYYIKV